jgi:type IV secretion system protein TrbF
VFFRKKKVAASDPSTAVGQLMALSNTPVAQFERAKQEFAEIYGSAVVGQARMFLLAIIAFVLLGASLLLLGFIFPLKEVRPWVVEVNPSTGVVNRPVQVEKVSPNVAVIRTELARWVEAVFMIDPLRSGEALRWANERAAEKAVAQFAEFRGRERIYDRMRTEPEMIREAKVIAVDASRDGTAFIFVTTSERSGSGAVPQDRVKRWRVTLNYRTSPATQEAALLANPLGLYVTFFSVTEERAL